MPQPLCVLPVSDPVIRPYDPTIRHSLRVSVYFATSVTRITHPDPENGDADGEAGDESFQAPVDEKRSLLEIPFCRTSIFHVMRGEGTRILLQKRSVCPSECHPPQRVETSDFQLHHLLPQK